VNDKNKRIQDAIKNVLIEIGCDNVDDPVYFSYFFTGLIWDEHDEYQFLQVSKNKMFKALKIVDLLSDEVVIDKNGRKLSE
jgi:hypothetical protein